MNNDKFTVLEIFANLTFTIN